MSADSKLKLNQPLFPPGSDSLLEAFCRWARRDPEAPAVIFLSEDGSRTRLSRGRVLGQAASFSLALQWAGVDPGDPVLIVLPHCPELIGTFWGALYRGAIPIILPYLNDKLDLDAYRNRVLNLIAAAGVRGLVAPPEFASILSGRLAASDCRLIDAGAALEGKAGFNAPPQPTQRSGGDTALIQFSSGTTGPAKGVVHSHSSLLEGISGLASATSLRADDVVINWLPLFHDMGMIAGFLLPLTSGIPTVLMSPFAWLRRPALLLRAVHEYHGSMCWMPNFAFNHVARSVQEHELKGLDLSSWRVLMNGSEPVRKDSLDQFVRRLGPAGFSANALCVGYGMTESNGPAATTPLGAPPPVDWVERRALQESGLARPCAPGEAGAMSIVSCGRPFPHIRLRIAGSGGEPLPDRRVGEVRLGGGQMFSEYFRAPDLTAKNFADGWFLSGDRGYLADGQLYICGRTKDVIINSGRNIHPEDLEDAANRVPGIYPGRAVAFGVMDPALGTEGVVMVCELRNPAAGPEERLAAERELRRRLVQELDVVLADLRLVADKGWVIKTTNGKIARAANRQKYWATLAAGGRPSDS